MKEFEIVSSDPNSSATYIKAAETAQDALRELHPDGAKPSDDKFFMTDDDRVACADPEDDAILMARQIEAPTPVA